MIFNDQGKIDRIIRVERNDAHKLIEECMLAANVCASDYLAVNEQPTLYRIHEGPTPEKLEALRTMLKDFGLTLAGGDAPQAKDYAALLTRIKDRPYAGLLQTVMLRSLRQAVYSPDNQGHFGLAYDAYAHFTSPIRRYPDLLVHRGIKAILKGERYEGESWEALGVHCSQTERRADEATRDVEAWLKCFYMQDRVGEILPGTISGVTGFGLFVTLDDLFVDGLVHISDLNNDYYQFDASKHSLVGERTGIRYQLGGRVNVKVVRVDLESSKIDFTLAAAVTKHESFRPPLKGEAPPEAGPPPPRQPKGAGKPRDQQKKMAKVETRNRDGAKQSRNAGKGKKKR
jgi:ribonuclease R